MMPLAVSHEVARFFNLGLTALKSYASPGSHRVITAGNARAALDVQCINNTGEFHRFSHPS
jgi:hypothetical protein